MQQTLDRLRAEFIEMPDLCLTIEQATRLCGVEPPMCRTILDALVDSGFLCLRSDGTYARAGDVARVVRPVRSAF